MSAVQIQQMKHSVPKGDKKKKKQVMAEIAVLQTNMEEKHKLELEKFDKNQVINSKIKQFYKKSSTMKPRSYIYRKILFGS